MKKIKKSKEANERGGIEFSFDFFAPDTEKGLMELLKSIRRMVSHNPSFCAISLVHEGRDADVALYTAHEVKNKIGVETMMHVTVSRKASVEAMERALDGLLLNGIDKILVFGPESEGGPATSLGLVRHVRAKYDDRFRIAVVGFPGGHPGIYERNRATLEGYMRSLIYLKEKVDAGADLIITPCFYDTDIFFKFLNDCQLIGITCPIVPGVMPIYSYTSLVIISDLSKIVIPDAVVAALQPIRDNDEAVRNYGIYLATKICEKIIGHGIRALHFQTLNMENSVMAVLQNLGLVDKAKIISTPSLKQKQEEEEEEHEEEEEVVEGEEEKEVPKKIVTKKFPCKIHRNTVVVDPNYVGLELERHAKKRNTTYEDYELEMQEAQALAAPEAFMLDPVFPRINRKVVTQLSDTQLPWLMLADDQHSITGRHSFFSLYDKNIYEIILPEAKWKRCVGSTDGWLITVDTNLEIGLLNTFSRIQIPLPRHPTFECWYIVGKMPSREYVMNRYIHKAFLSSPPSFSSNSCAVLAILNEKRGLAFARPGRSTIDWTPIQTYDMNEFQDAVFYKGRFYAVNRRAQLVVCSLSPGPKALEICRGPKSLLQCWSKYIVNLRDTLLLIGRHRKDDDGYYKTVNFKAYVLVPYGNERGGEGEEFKLKWKRVTNLRSLAVFIGGSTSMCVYADDIPGCQRNSIYYTDDHVGSESIYVGGPGSDMGIYNYEDGTIEAIYPGTSRSRLWPPIWVSPNQDLYEQSRNS